MTDDAYETGMPPLSVECIRELMRLKGAGVSTCVKDAATLRDDIRKRKLQVRQDAFLMRKNMRTEAQKMKALLSMFSKYRKHEQETPSVLDAFDEDIVWTQEQIESKIENYQKNLAELREECVRLCKKLVSSMDDADLKQAREKHEHDLGLAIKDFEETLLKLEQEAQNPRFELAAALHHLDKLWLATRDLFENTSWEELSDGMNALWTAFQKAFDSLIEVINAYLYPAEDMVAENEVPEVEQESEQAFDDEDDDLVTIELNTLPTEPPDPRPPALSMQSLDEKIEGFLKRLGDIREKEASGVKKEKQERDISFFSHPSVPVAMTALHADVTKVLIRAKQQDDFEPTSIQHAALQELRAEARRMIATANPSAFKKGWDEVKKRAEAGVVSVKEVFGLWAKEGAADDKENKPTKGPNSSHKK